MELKLNADRKTFREGLGLSKERYDQLLTLAKNWVKEKIKTKDDKVDILDYAQYCASICEDIQEYTVLVINAELIKEQAYRELYEQTCPRCKAHKEAHERREEEGQRRRFHPGFGEFLESMSRVTSNSPNVREVAPGVFIIL